MIDQLKQRRDREKRLQADVNTLVQLAAAFEDERDDLRALAVQLAEALNSCWRRERKDLALAAAKKAGLIK